MASESLVNRKNIEAAEIRIFLSIRTFPTDDRPNLSVARSRPRTPVFILNGARGARRRAASRRRSGCVCGRIASSASCGSGRSDPNCAIYYGRPHAARPQCDDCALSDSLRLLHARVPNNSVAAFAGEMTTRRHLKLCHV